MYTRKGERIGPESKVEMNISMMIGGEKNNIYLSYSVLPRKRKRHSASKPMPAEDLG